MKKTVVAAALCALVIPFAVLAQSPSGFNATPSAQPQGFASWLYYNTFGKRSSKIVTTNSWLFCAGDLPVRSAMISMSLLMKKVTRL